MTSAVRQQIARSAGEFIRKRYRMDAEAAQRLLDVPVCWRRGGGRSAFYPRACRGHAVPHIVLRVPKGAFARWNTYQRVRARWTTPRGGIELPIDLLMTTVLIHEYTHALQHGTCGGTKRRYSEVETTENEIEFIRLHAPTAFAQLVAVPNARRARPEFGGSSAQGLLRVEPKPLPGRFGPLRTSPRPTGMRAVALRLLRDIWVRCQVARAPTAAARPAR
ncbi:MAG: hypothetical protein JNK53_03750 [Phycisphaerae bacterium]|nr:hypothetical protein [Phycisphaerae bacterium]